MSAFRPKNFRQKNHNKKLDTKVIDAIRIAFRLERGRLLETFLKRGRDSGARGSDL